MKTLKYIFIFLLFSTALFAADEILTANFSKVSSSFKCVPAKSYGVFECQGEDNSKALIVYNGFSYTSTIIDKNGELSFPVMEKLNNNERELYSANLNYPGMEYIPTLTDENLNYQPRESLKNESIRLSAIRSNSFTSTDGKPITPLSPLQQEVLTIINSKLSKIEKQFKKSKLTVKLKDGKELNCKNAKDVPKKYADQPKKFHDHLKCGYFTCTHPELKDGENYHFFSNHSPNSMFNFLLLKTDSNNNFITESEVDGVYGSSPTPLMVGYNEPISMYGIAFSQSQPISNDKDLYVPSFMKGKESVFETLSTYMFKETIDSISQNCKKIPELEKLDEAYLSYQKQMSEAEIVNLVDFVYGTLEGFAVNSSAAKKIACYYEGIYYTPMAWEQIEALESYRPKLPRTISKEKAQELFDNAKAMNDIAWEFKEDGCYARAHLMARRFEEEGIYVDKAWAKGTLKVDGDPPIFWNFHVAPVVYVEDENGKVTPTVIDPSMMSSPVSTYQWVDKMDDLALGKRFDTAFPIPSNIIKYSRVSLSISSSSPYLPNDDINLTEDEKMRQANETMKRYQGKNLYVF